VNAGQASAGRDLPSRTDDKCSIVPGDMQAVAKRCGARIFRKCRLRSRAGFVGLAWLTWLAAGCLRLDEPDAFVCNSDEDCESGQRCPIAGALCVARDYCDDSIRCESGLHCAQARCVANECSYATAATDCHGFVCDTGVCRSSCAQSSDCVDSFHCDANACVPGAPLRDGQACSKAAECSSGTCCAKPSGAVCASSCPAVPDDSCTTGQDCLSGICCPRFAGNPACSSEPCAPLPECLGDTDCRFGKVCVTQKCEDPPPPKLPGEACKIGTECASGSCVADVCRGTAGEHEDCTIDADCEARRLCCKSTSDDESYCGELDRGCAGSIGDACESDFQCIDGDCNVDFCSKACTSNAECGVSPWGVPNACETNGLGAKICFPGCTTTEQCSDNISSTLECYDALDSDAKICAAG
jgi:hypothetical protein